MLATWMRRVPVPRSGRRRLVVLASSTLALAVVGCGSDDGAATAFAPVAGTESAYCDTFRAWQVHELEGDGDVQADPAALEAYFDDYLEFNATMLRQAPREVRDEWVVSEGFVRTVLTPVLRKYDFDVQRIAAEGTDAERSLSEPTPAAQKAQDAIHAYEARVCGVDPPPAADVVFEADESSAAFCAALSTYNGELEKVESSRFDPDTMRELLASSGFMEALGALDDTAPGPIVADVEAETDWYRTRWSDVVAELGYDIRRIWMDGTPEDRAVFTGSHPDVVEHNARTTAYEEQICTA